MFRVQHIAEQLFICTSSLCLCLCVSFCVYLCFMTLHPTFVFGVFILVIVCLCVHVNVCVYRLHMLHKKIIFQIFSPNRANTQ